MTTQDKLTRLIDTKIAIRQAIMNLGVDVPYDTPFSGYPELISKIVGDFEETTTDQDLLQMIDAYNFLGIDGYEDHTYTDEELQRINELIDIIINGPEEVEPELEPTVLLITDIGETRYHEGETFSLDGYTITAVYGDGRRVDVTADCSFTPSVELVTEDEYVTISCEIDGAILTVKQAIDVTVAPTFVDYLQSSNTQYINTEFLPNQDTTVEMKIFRTTPRAYWFGAWNTAYNNGAYALCNDSTNVYSGYDGQGGGTGSPISDGEHVVKLDKNIVYIDGEVFREFEYTNFQVNYSLYLFAQNRVGTAHFSSTSGENAFIMTECKIYDNGILVRDFKPCQDGEGVYCLYDAVRKKYHYNQGTGVFKGGNFVEATQLDYIESTGTQYIDTGVIPNSTTRMILDVSMTDLTVHNRNGWGSNEGAESFYLGTVTSRDVFNVSVSSNWTVTNSTVPVDKNRHIFDVSNNAIMIDDVSYGTGDIGDTATTGQTLYLFAFHTEYINTDIYYQPAKERIYSCKIYNQGVLIRDFVPYKDELGVVCLKDLIENAYYYNQGTGVFKGDMFAEPQQIDYIESTGTQYIDTGVTIAPTVGIELTFAATTKANTVFMGAVVLNSARFQPLTMSTTGAFNGSTDIAGTAVIYGSYDNDIHTLQYNVSNSEIVFDGVVKGTIASIGTANTPIHIFRRNYSDSPMPSSFRLCACKMYDNGELTKHLVPYKDEFGVVCMKDLVENKYYYNKGTGQFLAPIPENLTVVDYIQSTGTQYIDTEFIANQNTRVETKFLFEEDITENSWIFGARTAYQQNDFCLCALYPGLTFFSAFGTKNYSGVNVKTLTEYTVDKNKNVTTINGSSNTLSTSTFNTPRTLTLFALNEPSSIKGYSKIRLYYARIYDDGTMVRYMIPVIDENDVYCLYDRVNEKYYYNQGTGEFLGE